MSRLVRHPLCLKVWHATALGSAVSAPPQQKKALERIEVDTQGFRRDVLHGGETMLREGRIEAVLMEITFSEMYKDLPKPDEYTDLWQSVGFYDFHYQNNQCDALSPVTGPP